MQTRRRATLDALQDTDRETHSTYVTMIPPDIPAADPLPTTTLLADLITEVTDLKRQMQVQHQYNVIGDMSRCDTVLTSLKGLMPESTINRIQCGEKNFRMTDLHESLFLTSFRGYT
eukprot:GHVR01137737.1.p2 GENE.GHVR01137737.1~~GHVR01137737.1.p2  ORF type:complete len:117 (+),score=11.42 GHVR01137737.1:1877-2227(+)